MKTTNNNKSYFEPFEMKDFERADDFIATHFKSDDAKSRGRVGLGRFREFLEKRPASSDRVDIIDFENFVSAKKYTKAGTECSEQTTQRWYDAIRVFSRTVNAEKQPALPASSSTEIVETPTTEIVNYSLVSSDVPVDVLDAPNWADIIVQYFQENNVMASTRVLYQNEIRKFFDFCTSYCRSLKPTREMLRNYVDYNLNYLKNKPSTTESKLVILRGFFKYLGAVGLYQLNTDYIKTNCKRDTSYKRDVVPIDKIKEILSIAKNNSRRDYALFMLLFSCGLRGCEITRANVEDMRDVDGRIVLYLHGKGRDDKNDFVIVPTPVADAIKEYIGSSNNLTTGTPLFRTEAYRCRDNRRYSVRGLEALVDKYFRVVGIKSNRITLHSCRHTATTLSLMQGASLQEVQEMARHKNIQTTLVYAHNIKKLENQASEKSLSAFFNNDNSKNK